MPSLRPMERPWFSLQRRGKALCTDSIQARNAVVREQPPRQEGNPTNTRFVPATKLPSLDAVGGCREGGRLPNRFNLSWAQRTEPGPLKDEKDMETTGGSQWSSPPPARLPPWGAATWTPQDRPGQRARTICLLLFVVFWFETWDLAQESGGKQ